MNREGWDVDGGGIVRGEGDVSRGFIASGWLRKNYMRAYTLVLVHDPSDADILIIFVSPVSIKVKIYGTIGG